jgi:hypothetical protein
MLMSRWSTPLVLGIAALLIPAEGILGQGNRPSFPPGLHDRTLPPGRPFDGGGFDPPGLAGKRWALGPEEARELQQVLADSALAVSGDLTDAVAAFNRWVGRLTPADLDDPSHAFLMAHRLLRRHLGLDPSVLAAGRSNGEGRYPNGRPAGQDARRSHYFLPAPAQLWESTRRWAFPGMSAATPVGFGAEFGMVWAAASYQSRVRYNDGQDGAVAAGFGLGDARRLVGLQVGITSFSTVNSGFGDRMAVDLHLHRTFSDVYGLAVGWESVRGSWAVTRDSGENFYAVGSRWLRLRSDPDAAFGVGMVSLGLGSGRFPTESRFRDRRDGVGVFGSFGVRVAPPVSLLAEWTGQDVMLATSLTPLRSQRLAITAGFIDLTGAAGDGARFVLGGSMGYDFRGR